jgi:hypothetical protein
MRTINSVASEELRWIKPTSELPYELLSADDEVVGQLQLDRAWRGDSDTAGQRWTFRRGGFWRQHVTVRVPGSELNIAVFYSSWKKGGTLELEGGRKLRLCLPTLLKWQWTWRDSQGNPLVHLKEPLLASDCRVTIEKDAAESPDVPLLVVRGWYLLVVWAREAERNK